MRLKEHRVNHGFMTAPAKEGDIGPEADITRPVLCRVRFRCMADETDRPTVYDNDLAIVVKHFMRIDLGVLIFRMTLKADFPSIAIRTSTQKLGACNMVIDVAGQTFYFPIEKWERVGFRISGCNIDRMVVFLVIVAVEALLRRIDACLSCGEEGLSRPRLGCFSKRFLIAGGENEQQANKTCEERIFRS